MAMEAIGCYCEAMSGPSGFPVKGVGVTWAGPTEPSPCPDHNLGLSASIFGTMWRGFSKEEHVLNITLAVVWKLALGGGMETRRPNKSPVA